MRLRDVQKSMALKQEAFAETEELEMKQDRQTRSDEDGEDRLRRELPASER